MGDPRARRVSTSSGTGPHDTCRADTSHRIPTKTASVAPSAIQMYSAPRRGDSVAVLPAALRTTAATDRRTARGSSAPCPCAGETMHRSSSRPYTGSWSSLVSGEESPPSTRALATSSSRSAISLAVPRGRAAVRVQSTTRATVALHRPEPSPARALGGDSGISGQDYAKPDRTRDRTRGNAMGLAVTCAADAPSALRRGAASGSRP